MGSRGILGKDAFYPVLQVAPHQQLRHEVGVGVHHHLLRRSLQMVLVMAEVKKLVHEKVQRHLVVHVHNALVQIDRQGGLGVKGALLLAYLVGCVVAQ